MMTTHHQRKKRLVPSGIFLNKTLDHMLAHNILHHKLSLKAYCLVTTTGHTLMERPFFIIYKRMGEFENEDNGWPVV